MCKFTSDSHGRFSCQANKKWLDFIIRDPSKKWCNLFFFMKNEWSLPEKRDRLKELSSSLHVGEEDVLRILNFFNTVSLQQELCYIRRCMMEECLFKVGIYTQAGRSHVIQLKKFVNVHETTSSTLKHSVSHPLEVCNLSPRDPSHVQEAYEKLFNVEVKDLELQSLEQGFTRGFLKGVWLVHCRTRVEIEELTPSQASGNSSLDSSNEDIQSELKKILFSNDDDVDIA
ncbi:hypothetical protein IEQ34_004678 [Dendrobium chrysotoxum]|uniref:Uncharacterized protein n=1 Tax=Dendrobium chrysotoxum TaxID=161865 RepID=A0AAV7HH44_DENCH|nr:hypothetical protein IEQ34_004678 [Dendrobium chrysotoxum]